MTTVNSENPDEGIEAAAAEWFARRLDARNGDGPVVLGSDADAQFEAWLSADVRHRQAYELMIRTADDITWVNPERPAVRKRKAIPALGVGIAASLIIAVSAASYFVLTQPQRLRTTVGETRLVTLRDGTRVSLSGDTVIEVQFTRASRQIVLKQGAAYFDVAKAAAPFSVRAADIDVRDIGTQFNINLRRNSVEVNVVEGKVVVSSTAPNSPSALSPTEAEAGQRIRIARTGPTPRGEAAAAAAIPGVSILRPEQGIAIREGRQIYDNAPLGEIVEDINRYYGPGIVIRDESAARKRITATFLPKDVGAFIGGLPMAASVRVKTTQTGAVEISSTPGPQSSSQ